MSQKDRFESLASGLATVPTTASRGSSAIGLGRTRGGSTPATSALAHFSEEMSELKKSAGQPTRVRMDLCDDGPYHTSPLDPDRVAALQSNLAANPQSTPAVLRRKDDGRYQIVAGRHRKAALTNLGHEEWDAVFRDIDDDTAERLTFYDNLLAPELTDYARYCGFAQRRESRGLTLEQLAQESGVSKSTIGRLLAFGQLSERSLDDIGRTPKLFGASLVESLSQLIKAHGTKVDDGIERVAHGTLAAKDLIKWITTPQQATPKPAVNEHVVKQGKRNYAKVITRGDQLTIKVPGATPEEVAAIQDLVIKALASRVAAKD